MSYAKLRGDFSLATTQRFTASADVSDGDLVVENDRVGIAFDDTANGAEGIMIVATDGKGILMPKTTGAISRNARVYFDADGNPIGGTAGSGAMTATATDNVLVGYAVEAAASGDAEVLVHLTGV
ncbi:MAG: DUF2190 family protein [Bacteroidota bacterium]